MDIREQSVRARTQLALLAATLTATFLVFLRTGAFAFVYDDATEIVNNPGIHSWSNLAHVFTTPFLRTPYYRPLVLIWLRCCDALFGTHPAGWHMMSVLANVAVTALVYLVARKLAGAWPALIAAALFGLHPVHIESVAWISAVVDPLYAGFFLAAFLAYLKSTESRRLQWTLVSCALYAAALLSKEPAIVFPAVVAAHALLFADKDRLRQAIRAVLPSVIVTAVYIVVRLAVVPPYLNPGSAISIRTTLLTEPSILLLYVSKLFWPVGLSGFYDKPYVSTFSLAHFVLPLVALLLIAIALVVWARRSEHENLIAFSVAWFLLTLAPALNFRLLVPGEFLHDRYLYLPSFAFCLLVGIALEGWSKRLSMEPRYARIPAAIAVAVCVCFAGLNLVQQGPWASDVALYSHGFVAAPNNNFVENNFARLLTDRGQFREAIPLYEQVLRRDPNFEQAHYNLGYTYYRFGDLAQARRELQRAVALNPLDSFAYIHLGLISLREHDVATAETEIRRAIQIDPARPGFHAALSFVLEAKGDIAGALAEMREELQYTPNNPALRAREQALLASLANQKSKIENQK
ncbi:MAG: tetratricopeptide repeat protein [Terriglobales bacterium]